MATVKVSTGKIDIAAPLAANEGSPFLEDIDPSGLRVFTGTISNAPAYLLGGFSAGNPSSPYIVDGDGVVDEGGVGSPYVDPVKMLSALIPQLGDISIKSQEVDWTTTPPTVKVVLRVKNSTGKEVIGLKGLRSA